jgi:hypothetical protein
LFVRQAAREVFQWRRLLAKGDAAGVIARLKAAVGVARDFGLALQTGRKAARTMWTRTRSSLVQGQNETILEADTKRLTQWRLWLKRACKDPALILQATPVCGVWQLQLLVHNIAPAGQKVVIEQQIADGSWHEIASRYTMEFRAYAARPLAKIKRELTLPLEHPDGKIRIRAGGVGQLSVSQVRLTDGVTSVPFPNYKPKRILGRPAPRRGLPLLV